MTTIKIDFIFSTPAKALLPEGKCHMRCELPPHVPAQLRVGDSIRFAGIPKCPWLVVTRRGWDLNDETTTLVLWLDSPAR